MIYINGRFLLQNQTGVNRFAYELCRALAEMGVPFILCCPPGVIKDCYDVSGFSIWTCGWGKSHLWEQISLPWIFHRIKGEKVLLNFTGLSPLFVRKKVMTIHDLAFWVNPKWYSLSYRFLYRLLTPLCAFTSMKVLTVSEFSKNEIIRLLGIDRQKTVVVYNAVPFFFRIPTVKNCMEKGKYVLAVSSIDPRKNFFTLLRAFAYVKAKDIKLYIIGGEDKIYSASIRGLEKMTKSGKVKWLGRVSDDELKQFYERALCFVYPSLYEGFGIPPLEAMSCGTPTVVSAIPPIKEVCGNAALYVNPYDEKDIAEKINLLIEDADLRKSLIVKGYERCQMFDWHRSANILINVVENLYSEK